MCYNKDINKGKDITQSDERNKRMKRIMMITMTIITMLFNSLTVEAPSKEDSYKAENIYSISTIVDNVDYENDIVIVIDSIGNEWVFEGCEDWFVGDVCVLTMYDNSTDVITDDVIIKTTYNGYVN